MACTDFAIKSPVPLSIRLPGGAVITGVTQGASPSDLDVVRAISGQVAALLAPFQGIFDLVATVQLVLETVQAIPSAIASLSPGKITEKLSELAGKVQSLGSYLPAVAIPRLAKDAIELVSRNNAAIREVIISLQAQQNGAAEIEIRAQTLEDAGLPDAAVSLRISGQCLTDQVSDRMSALNAGQGPLDQLIGIINSLLGLVPGIPIPPLPTMGALSDDLDDALATVNRVDELLGPIRTALAGI